MKNWDNHSLSIPGSQIKHLIRIFSTKEQAKEAEHALWGSFGKACFLVSKFRIYFIFNLVIWHSDKPMYQKECGLKIAALMQELPENE